MADINDRLDRLQRRQEFDRNGLPLRPEPGAPGVARPAGVDDRLGEVLDAVAAVVRRHPGLSVMVAVADGRAGRPVVRVTERDGDVETGVVVVSGPGGSAPAPATATPTAAGQTAAVPTDRPRDPEPPVDGRHAARPERAPSGWSGSSWHDSLWSAGAQARFRDAGPPGHRRPDGEADTDRLRLVPDAEPAPPAPPGGTIPLPEDTSQVVSRLAQLLRDNPSLTSSWSREAPEAP